VEREEDEKEEDVAVLWPAGADEKMGEHLHYLAAPGRASPGAALASERGSRPFSRARVSYPLTSATTTWGVSPRVGASANG